MTRATGQNGGPAAGVGHAQADMNDLAALSRHAQRESRRPQERVRREELAGYRHALHRALRAPEHGITGQDGRAVAAGCPGSSMLTSPISGH